MPDGLVVRAGDPSLVGEAKGLGERLGAPVVDAVPTSDECLSLVVSADGLCLRRGNMSLSADLTRMLPRLRRSNLSRELLVRAARIRGDGPRTAFDATAGLGEDSLLLAAAGFEVTLYERDPVVYELLADGLRRAAAVPGLAEAVGRMQARRGDSVSALGELDAAPDVVLLDPMFPERRKSASVKKKLQMIQRLERPCENETSLLSAALGVHPRKVVIKRPAKGPWLAGAKPSYTVEGKAIRYDVIVPPRG
jgi:16S rRNA (guanine1516-N2)-methyltransferase